MPEFRSLLILLCMFVMTNPGVHAQESHSDPLFGGTVHIKVAEEDFLKEAAVARTIVQRQLASIRYPRLLDYDADGNLIPVMIKSWREEDSGRKITFYLENLYASGDVSRINAGDILESIKYLLRTNPDSPAAIILRDISGVKDYLRGESELEGLEIIDDQTIVFHLDHPQPLLLHAFADINLALSRFLNRPEYIATGLGPFEKENATRMKANLSFISGRPYLDYVISGEGAKQPAGARRNVVISITPEALTASKSGTVGQLIYPGKRCFYLAVNSAGTNLKRLGHRLGVARAIDPDALVNIFFAESGERMKTLIPEAFIPANIQQLDSASVKQTHAARTIKNSLVLGYARNNPQLKLVAERLKVDLLVKGFEVKLREISTGRYSSCDLFVFSTLISKATPEYSLWMMLNDLYWKTGSDKWLQQPSGDELLWLSSISTEFIGSASLIPLFQEEVMLRHDSRLRGLSFRPDGTVNLESAWISYNGK